MYEVKHSFLFLCSAGPSGAWHAISINKGNLVTYLLTYLITPSHPIRNSRELIMIRKYIVVIDSCHGLGLGHGSRVMWVTGQLTDGHVGHGSPNVAHCQLWFMHQKLGSIRLHAASATATFQKPAISETNINLNFPHGQEKQSSRKNVAHRVGRPLLLPGYATTWIVLHWFI